MRHVSLTCVNHPHLRWSCKEIAVDNLGRYNGARSIFYHGTYHPEDVLKATHEEPECRCGRRELRFSPEELARQQTEPLEG